MSNCESKKTTLVIVCKNKDLTNLLKELVESEDDIDEANVVGTKDGSVKIETWDEKKYLERKASGSIPGKIILLGDIRGAKQLCAYIDVKYNKYGVKYGWQGNYALISADPKALRKEEDYELFLSALRDIVNSTLADLKECDAKDSKDENTKKGKGGLLVAGLGLGLGLYLAPLWGAIGAGIGLVAGICRHNAADQKEKEKGQLVFGITMMYRDHLAEFLES